MEKVVSINAGQFLGSYRDTQNNKQFIPEDSLFVAGVLLSMVLPELIYIAYGGFLPLIAFAGSAVAGSTWGVAMYYKSPERTISYASTGIGPKSLPGESTRKFKKVG
jgi:hypothetical protein